MERIKKVRIAFCRYLYAIAGEKKITIDDIVQKTNRSYTDIKKIFEGLISPTLDDLIVLADVLNMHITVNPEISLAHKKIANEVLLSADSAGTLVSEE